MTRFESATYWEGRYGAGGTSGAGSYGRLARFKADIINAFVAANGITGILDLGCGDGHLLSLLDVPAYTGVDVSATVLASCTARYPQHRFLLFSALDTGTEADLALSIDVIFHLVEDPVFTRHMQALFARARRFVLIYSSNLDGNWSAPHVRHRRFTDHVGAHEPEWRLLAHLPNPYPYDPGRPNETSFADFFIYGRAGVGCSVRVPDAI